MDQVPTPGAEGKVIGQIANVAVALLLAVFFIWLFSGARRTRNPILRWVGTILLAIPTLVLSLVTIVALVGFYRVSAPVSRPVPAISASGVPADRVAQAQRMAVLCAGCHSLNNQVPLTGGPDFGTGNGPPFGTLSPSNLTPGGPLKDWSDGEIARAIREGIDKDGRPLIIMPSETLRNLSDEDTAATIAYLRSEPASPNVIPERSLNLIGLLIIGSGLFPTSVQPQITAPVVAAPRAVNAAYGKYLVDSVGCQTCHGNDLAGIPPGGLGPSGPNLTTKVPTWSEEGFVKTIRTGVEPSGYALNPDLMPWKGLSSALEDDQLQAMYAYLHGLTPIQK
jgi:mono/diheme cytochrome c family protein